MSTNYEIQKYDYLDWLRGFAIFGTIFAHIHSTQISFLQNLNSPYIMPIGFMGVPLFFIISAYTLALSQTSREKKEEKPIKNFYIRRFFRIYPLFASISILLFLVFNSPFAMFAENTTINPSFKNLILHLTFTYGFVKENTLAMGEWSLFCEMIFYLFFPLLFFIVKKHKKILFLLLIISLIIFAISIFNNEDLWYTSLKKAMYSFLLGFTLFKLKDINISKILLKILSIINILIYILLPIIIHLFELKYLFELDIILLPILIGNLALTIFLFIKGYFNIGIQKLAKFLKFSGEISYSLYLQNFLFLTGGGHIFNKFIFSHYGHNLFVEIILMIFVLCLMYLFAYLSYKLIEQPGIALGKKIIQKYSK